MLNSYDQASCCNTGTMKLIWGQEEQLIGSLLVFKHFGLAYRLVAGLQFHILIILFDNFLSLSMTYEKQVLVGDIFAANSSHREFFEVWKKFGVLPERYFLILLVSL